MTNTLFIMSKKEKVEMIAKIAIATFAILLLAPFTFMLVKGLLGVAMALIVASTCIAFAPAVSLAIANGGVKALKYEAARNPVETLQNEYKEKSLLLEEKLAAIKRGAAKCKTFENKIIALKSKYPDEAPQFEAQHKIMLDLLTKRKTKYRNASKKLNEFRDVVAKADALWQVTEALNDVSSDQGKVDEFYSEIRTTTALDSIQDSLSRSFAALDTSLLEEEVEREDFLMSGTGKLAIEDEDEK